MRRGMRARCFGRLRACPRTYGTLFKSSVSTRHHASSPRSPPATELYGSFPMNQPVMQGACCFFPKSCRCARFDCCCFSRGISARSQACSVLHLIASAVS